MLLKIFRIGPMDNCVYLVADAGEAMAIDPAAGSFDVVMEEARKINAKIKLAVNTHGHFDHIADNARFQSAGAKLACHRDDENFLRDPRSQGFNLPFPVEPSVPDALLKEGDVISAGNLVLKVMHLPGHTPGSIALYAEKERLLFTGDTLFAGTYGRTDFRGGSEKDIFASLKRLAQLPGSVRVYPGHGEATSIGKEEKWIKEL